MAKANTMLLCSCKLIIIVLMSEKRVSKPTDKVVLWRNVGSRNLMTSGCETVYRMMTNFDGSRYEVMYRISFDVDKLHEVTTFV